MGQKSRAPVLLVLLGLSALIVPATAWAGGDPRVVIETTMGDIVLELYPDRAPETVKNFLTYVRDGHYDGTLFYRITDFLIQAGSTNPDYTRRPTRDPIPNEAGNGLVNVRGSLGMARHGHESATAEFYINTTDNSWLDHQDQTESGWGYCVFGRVIEGMDTVDTIAAVPAATRGEWESLPKEKIHLEKAYVVAEGLPAAEQEAPVDPASITVHLTGTLTDGGVECQALQGIDGRLYSLVGDLGDFGPGDEVRIEGHRAEASTCMQGITVKVQTISRSQ